MTEDRNSQNIGPTANQRRDLRLRRWQRLTSSALFQETYAQERRFVGRLMVLWLRSGADASLRLGVVASRKVGGAVQRARAKRRMREVFRLHRHLCRQHIDVILVARHDIVTAAWNDVRADFLRLANKAGLIVDHRNEGQR